MLIFVDIKECGFTEFYGIFMLILDLFVVDVYFLGEVKCGWGR